MIRVILLALAFVILSEIASAAVPSSVLLDSRVFFIKRMPADAEDFSCVHGSEAQSSHEVLAVSDLFEMVGVDAAMLSADVIEFLVLFDRTSDHLEAPSMCLPGEPCGSRVKGADRRLTRKDTSVLGVKQGRAA